MPHDFWAMERKALADFRKFKDNNPLSAVSESVREFEKRVLAQSGEDFIVVNGVAIIKIRGHLGNWPSFWGYLLDGSIDSYPLIIEKLALASSSDEVTRIRLLVDTPGGQLDGLFPLLDALKSTTKPLEAVIGSRADSAGYGIVSQVDKIIASGIISEVGSVGVGTTFFVNENFVDITSSDAPKKWPDVTKESGVEVVRGELDEIHAKFAKYISEGRSAATGRNITIDIVNQDFGRGGTMLAEAGLAAGMIDEIIPAPERVSNAYFFNNSEPSSPGAASNIVPKIEKMDTKTLRNEHPDTYAEIMQLGVNQERERVEALLDTGSECGKMDKAVEFVKDGSCITQPKTTAAFLSARINNQDLQNREKDNPSDVDTPDPDDTTEEADAKMNKFLADRKKRGMNRA
ncbi:MAG: hypothetical protein GY854_16525 [Deltaproteobacteria bacterium]|nr:hypothetical protein [Deltaproteobacteria bacterium]